MMELSFARGERPFHILCLGAHCDDIEIGCGATLLKFVEEYPALSVTWVVFSSNEIRAEEARTSAAVFLGASVSKKLIILEHRNGYFPYCGSAVKDSFEKLKREPEPDLIFTHYGQDRHQDHRVISELTWNTFRNHLILEYEIPKYDGGLGTPNVYVPATKIRAERKSENLLKCFESQRQRSWFSKSTFDSLMRMRAIECNAPSEYAEAFYARKVLLG